VAHIPHGDALFGIDQYDIFSREPKRKLIYIDFLPSVRVLSSITAISFLKITLKESGFTGFFTSLGVTFLYFDIENGLTS